MENGLRPFVVKLQFLESDVQKFPPEIARCLEVLSRRCDRNPLGDYIYRFHGWDKLSVSAIANDCMGAGIPFTLYHG